MHEPLPHSTPAPAWVPAPHVAAAAAAAALLLCVQHARVRDVLAGTALGVGLQAALGAPFLRTYPHSYLTRAFEFSRVGVDRLSSACLPGCLTSLVASHAQDTYNRCRRMCCRSLCSRSPSATSAAASPAGLHLQVERQLGIPARASLHLPPAGGGPHVPPPPPPVVAGTQELVSLGERVGWVGGVGGCLAEWQRA